MSVFLVVSAAAVAVLVALLCWQAATVRQIRKNRMHMAATITTHLRQRDAQAAEARKAARQRDGYADALAAVAALIEQGDTEGALAHAHQALETGRYTGRLAGALEALERAEGELAALRRGRPEGGGGGD